MKVIFEILKEATADSISFEYPLSEYQSTRFLCSQWVPWLSIDDYFTHHSLKTILLLTSITGARKIGDFMTIMIIIGCVAQSIIFDSSTFPSAQKTFRTLV